MKFCELSFMQHTHFDVVKVCPKKDLNTRLWGIYRNWAIELRFTMSKITLDLD